ncbi:MAG: hypothetical protein IT372_34525 [Polyangiaceae bacterium]|nr:hypothetical protein [Polyangiaceae bacterium]
MKHSVLWFLSCLVALGAWLGGPRPRAARASPEAAGEVVRVGHAHKVTPEPAAGGERFGGSVALWGHTAVVGAPGLGLAYAFEHEQGAVLRREGELAPSGAAAGFGAAVAVWGDTAVVGAPGGSAATGAGEAYVFVRQDGAWTEEAVLSASDGLPGDQLGAAVALSGDMAVVGAPGADGAAGASGAAYVFTREGGVWTQRAKLVAADGVPGGELGASVGAWSDAVVVGAPHADGVAAGSGAAHVFRRGPLEWVEEAKLAAPEGGELDRYGAAVALFEDIVIIGAPGAAPRGAAHVLTRHGGAWAPAAVLTPNDRATLEFGAGVALWDRTALVGAAGPRRGAELFTSLQGAWTFARKLMDQGPADGGPGHAIALGQTAAIIGAQLDSEQGAQAGAIYAFPLARVGAAAASTLSCSSATTLSSLATCIRNQMPRSGYGGYRIPTAAEQADWRAVVASMLGGACGFALPTSLSAAMQINTFRDADNGKSYCVLMEVSDADSNGVVDRGWGTFIVDPTAARELSHQAPHPIHDSNTETEAIDLFKWSDSRSYLMCGAHRLANAGASACDADYRESDCAHATANMYHPTTLEIDAFYGAEANVQVQWHGMASTTCPGVNAYLSQGLSTAPPAGADVRALEANVELANPTWSVDVPGGNTCSMNATDNVQGRFLNGVPEGSVCTVAAAAASGEFMSVEQQPEYRAPARWSAAVKTTWPPAAAPAAPEGVVASPGNGQVTLGWIASSGADTYTVWSATTAGGPFAPVAAGVTGASFLHVGLTNGTTYHYVITARNALGESAPSREVAATPAGPPLAPTNLVATPGLRRVTLTWTASAGATSYKVKRSLTSGGPYATVATVGVPRYSNGGLTTGVTYHFVVSAVSALGESPNSTQVSATAQ